MAANKTAVLIINGAAISSNITIDVASVLAPDGEGHNSADAVDVWTGNSLGTVTAVSEVVPPHGNVFLVLSSPNRL